MTGRARRAATAALALALVACSPGAPPPGDAAPGSRPSTSAARPSTAPAAPAAPPAATGSTVPAPGPTTSTTSTVPPVPRLDLPPVPAGGPVRAVVTPSGVVAAVAGPQDPGGGWPVRLPCAGVAVVAGTPLRGAHVVLDPGHGGDEQGAVGPNGLEEKDLNLAVAERAAALLREVGATVVLTRTADYRVTLQSRAEIAVALGALAFVSVHHNAVPDGPSDGPGTEAYFQVASPPSRRLAGLLWEEVSAALAGFDVAWVADRDAGAKPRLAGDGGDYYGILRRSAGVPAALLESAFLSNPEEAALLAGDDAQAAIAAGIARAVGRFLGTDDPGSGFVDPYPRNEPAGPGGGATGCVDPPLG